MAVGRAERREARRERAIAVFGEDWAPIALDLLELTELAWHDCYAEVSPSEDIVEDMLVLSEGTIGQLVEAALLGVTDWRDLKVAADEYRRRSAE